MQIPRGKPVRKNKPLPAKICYLDLADHTRCVWWFRDLSASKVLDSENGDISDLFIVCLFAAHLQGTWWVLLCRAHCLGLLVRLNLLSRAGVRGIYGYKSGVWFSYEYLLMYRIVRRHCMFAVSPLLICAVCIRDVYAAHLFNPWGKLQSSRFGGKPLKF